MYYVYVIRSLKDSQLYIGFTEDLPRRFKDHNDGKVESTKNRLPFELVYYSPREMLHRVKINLWQAIFKE
ncbi:MAG: GIY-YIG nuclease family protein [Desulfurellaceae bacterium]|nr:GIY-YIG nuclease family protein [Desulfurellaceae bacterium]